jgi:hypothetical protein
MRDEALFTKQTNHYLAVDNIGSGFTEHIRRYGNINAAYDVLHVEDVWASGIVFRRYYGCMSSEKQTTMTTSTQNHFVLNARCSSHDNVLPVG